MSESNEKDSIKRGAWNYQKRGLPAFSTLFQSSAERRRFMREWITKPIGYLMDLIGHLALKLLPIDVCSNVGAFLGRVVMKTKHKGAVANIRRNLDIILPDASVAEKEVILTRNCENLGRLMTEFSVLTRICRDEERVKIVGLEAVLQTAKSSPIVLIVLHLGNWEVLSSISKRIGMPFHTFFLPLDNPVERWVTARVRQKLGANLLPEGMTGIGPALQILKQVGVVSLLCDEAFAGEIRGPLFGRPAHLKGNLALATRLARRTGAKLCILNTVRQEEANFECHFSPMITLPGQHDARVDEDMLNDVRFVNALVEPIVKRHLDQWYYLHERL
jgi:Kdo2-lipid IVA lauroyltransferase/acyltransferase